MPIKDKKYNPWWAKVIFDDFCAHYIGMSDVKIVEDVKESIKALLNKDTSGNSFGSSMVRLALDRIALNRETRGIHGGEGGRPRNDIGQEIAPVAKKPNQLVYGRHGNVYMTQDQYTEFCRKVGNLTEAHRIIDALSGALEDGSKTSRNHYATLLRWDDYRKEKDEKNAENGYETISEHNRRVLENSNRMVDEFYGVKKQ